MTPLAVIADDDKVRAYLAQSGLEVGFVVGYVPIEAVLLQAEGIGSGEPALLFIVTVDGKKVVAKTALHLMQSAMRAINSAAAAVEE